MVKRQKRWLFLNAHCQSSAEMLLAILIAPTWLPKYINLHDQEIWGCLFYPNCSQPYDLHAVNFHVSVNELFAEFYLLDRIEMSLLRFRLIPETNSMAFISNTLKRLKFKCQKKMKCDNLKVSVVVRERGEDDGLLLMQTYCSYWRVSFSFYIFTFWLHCQRNLRHELAVTPGSVRSLSVRYTVQQIHTHRVLQGLKIGIMYIPEYTDIHIVIYYSMQCISIQLCFLERW